MHCLMILDVLVTQKASASASRHVLSSRLFFTIFVVVRTKYSGSTHIIGIYKAFYYLFACQEYKKENITEKRGGQSCDVISRKLE